MHRHYHTIVKPFMEMARSRVIVEVGSERGINTANLLKYCDENDGLLHVVDYAMGCEPLLLGHPRARSRRGLSLDVLPEISGYDTVLLDGDHNWYTVYNELRCIEAEAVKRGAFPVVFFHDTGHPYARRDLYCLPASIPEEFRHAYGTGGVLPGRDELDPEEGNNLVQAKALLPGGPKNGVLTAIEDFYEQTAFDLAFVSVPHGNGCGILFSRSLLADPGIRNFVKALTSVWDAEPNQERDPACRFSPGLRGCANHPDAPLCADLTVLIASAGNAEILECCLRRFRHHSPDNLRIRVIHSGPGAEPVRALCDKYHCRFEVYADALTNHPEVLDHAVRTSDTGYVFPCDSDAFPVDDHWLRTFMPPLLNGQADAVGPLRSTHLLEEAPERGPLAIPHIYARAMRRSLFTDLGLSHARKPRKRITEYGVEEVLLETGSDMMLEAQLAGRTILCLPVTTKVLGDGVLAGDVFFHFGSSSTTKILGNQPELHPFISRAYLELLHREKNLLSGTCDYLDPAMVRRHLPVNIDTKCYSRFIFDNLERFRGKSVAFWGVGGRFKTVYLPFLRENEEVFDRVLLFDKMAGDKMAGQGMEVDGRPVLPVDQLDEADMDFLVISTTFRDAVLVYLRERGFNLDKVLYG